MRANGTANSFKLAGLALSAAAVATAVGLVGCSSTATPPGGTSSSTSSSASSSASASASGTAETTSTGVLPTGSTSVQVGDTMVYASVGQTATVACEAGKSLNVTGSDNTLTVTGACETLSVGGTKNNITVDKVNTRITILGMDNTVTYKDGEPKVDKLGPNNTVTKG